MASFFLKIYKIFVSRRLLLWIIILVITAGLAYLASGIELEEDITRFIPHDEKLKKYTNVFQNIKINDKIIVAIHLPDECDSINPDMLIAYGAELTKNLTENPEKNYIKDITFKLSAELMSDVYDIFYRNLPYFLDDEDYKRIDTLLNERSISQSLDRDFRTLVTPAGSVFRKFIVRDPLGFTSIAVSRLSKIQVQDNITIYKDCIFTKDKKNLLLFISSANPSNETAHNTLLIKELEKQTELLSEKFNGVQACWFGAVPVAVGNARQMKQDSIITLSIAIIVLLILLSFFFKKKRILILIILPVIAGALFSVSILYLIKGEISTIVIGAGSIILGIAINYSIHFFTHLKHVGSPVTTIKELANPMTIGSITTIGAFLSLLFVKSQALNDFGLFAALVLIGAVLYTLIVLPHQSGKYVISGDKNIFHSNNFIEKIASIRFENSKIWLAIIFILTLFFLYHAKNVGFESDLSKLNYTSDELRLAEKRLNTITDSSLKALYIVSTGDNFDEALKNSEQLNNQIDKLKKRGLIFSYSSVSTLLLSSEMQQDRADKWNSYWTESKKDTLKQRLSRLSKANKFHEDAFAPFIEFINSPPEKMTEEDINSVKDNFLSEYITEKDGQSLIVTLIKTKEENKRSIIAAIPENENTVIIDRQYIASKFSDVINDDFNTILLLTSLLVLIFLIVSYGRIELGILAFIPMLISWIWILGIMGLAGIKFNVFSIILSAFIFGLGDDYSIFIMDGLLQEYKTGRKSLNSYKTAVFLSALTTIIGVGVLIFAKHPALQSIAITTIIGMLSVVIISYTTAPAIFKWMINIKSNKRTFPVTLTNMAYAFFCYSWFITGCTLTVLYQWTIINLLPISFKRKKIEYHRVLFRVCRSTIKIMFLVRKRYIGLKPDTFDKPAVVICNHQSLIDIPLALMWTPKMVMMTNDRVYKSKIIGKIVQLGGFFSASSGHSDILHKLKELVADGYSIFVFPEGTRSSSPRINRFHKGAFYLAEQLNIDILPMVMHGTGDYVKKGEIFGRKSTITVKFLDRIKPDDNNWGTGYKERTKKIQQLYRNTYKDLIAEYYQNPDYYKDLVIKNFIYKGPIIEWYVKVKLRLEKNYRLFHEILPLAGKITDIGCGYGFMSYMLAFSSTKRIITGLDYDNEKIEVANSGISKPSNTNFIHADILNFELPESDAFIISDVLHYIPEEDQKSVISKCIEKLNSEGKIIIREADSSLDKKHLGTRFTEFFSTGIGFNKTGNNNKLFFTSREIVISTAKKYNLAVEIIDNTRYTSNIFYIIKK